MIPLICSLSGLAHAESEGELWTEAGVEFEPVKRLELGYSQHYRVGKDFSEPTRWMHEVGIGYEIFDALKVGAGYRLSYELDEPIPCCTHRVNADVGTQADVGDVRFKLRERYQWSFREEKRKQVWRTKLGVQLRTWDLVRPFADGEVYVRTFDEEKSGIQTWRATAGVEFSFDPWEVEGYYRAEFPTDEDDPTLHIAGLGLEYSF